MAIYLFRGDIKVRGTPKYQRPLFYTNGSRTSLEIRWRKHRCTELVFGKTWTTYSALGILWIRQPRRTWILSREEARDIAIAAAKQEFDDAFEEFAK